MTLLKACLNGARRPHEHQRLPVTADEIATDAVATREAGAGAVHVHVKNSQGEDTLAATATDSVVAALRNAAPGLPVGLTTGAWALPDPAERAAAIQAWSKLPDFASVNWHEDGADLVASTLLDRGVQVEAGLWHREAVQAWLASPFRDRCFRILLELQDGIDEAETIKQADDLMSQVSDRGIVVLLHGEGTSCWPALRYSRQLGLTTRIGLEDTLTMPSGETAPDNATLVAAARRWG